MNCVLVKLLKKNRKRQFKTVYIHLSFQKLWLLPTTATTQRIFSILEKTETTLNNRSGLKHFSGAFWRLGDEEEGKKKSQEGRWKSFFLTTF